MSDDLLYLMDNRLILVFNLVDGHLLVVMVG